MPDEYTNGLHDGAYHGGDRYQNGIYLEAVSGLLIEDIETVRAAYHGLAANALQDSRVIGVDAHDNYGDGVCLTGRVDFAAGVEFAGRRTAYVITARNNGLIRNGLNGWHHQEPLFHHGGTPYYETNRGVYAYLQYGIFLHVISENSRSGYGMQLVNVDRDYHADGTFSPSSVYFGSSTDRVAVSRDVNNLEGSASGPAAVGINGVSEQTIRTFNPHWAW